MKLLFLANELPTQPLNGPRLKLFSILNYTGQRHQCDVIAFDNGDAERRVRECERIAPGVRVLKVLPSNEGLRLVGRRLRRLVLDDKSPAIDSHYTAEGVTAVRVALDRGGYDAVHVDTFSMAAYIHHLPGLCSIMSVNDAISLSFKRLAETEAGAWKRRLFRMKAKRTEATERALLPLFRVVHVVSGADAAYLSREICLTNLRVITLPARAEWLIPTCEPNKSASTSPAFFTAGHLYRGFTWKPLARFLDEQWPTIIRRYPGATITLIGSNPPDQLRRAASRVGVSLFEYVDNYAQLLQRADIVFFLDQSGTGIKTRVIEAMANAKPLIVTESVLEGIGACHGAECLVANTPENAAAAAFQLLESPALMSSLGVRAQHFIRCRFTNETIGEQWERLYMEVACD